MTVSAPGVGLVLIALMCGAVAFAETSPPTSGASPKSNADELAAAVRAFNTNFDPADAKQQLLALLQHHPPARVAATAHVYLGLIALNGFDQAGAQLEFEQALRADVLVELPPDRSPKAELLFARARQEMLIQEPAPAATPLAAPSTVAPAPPPPTLMQPWSETPAPSPTSPSRLPSSLVGGAAVAALAVGLVFGLALQPAALSAAKSTKSAPAAETDESGWSTDGVVADVLFGAAALGAGATLWLVIAESPSSSTRASGSTAAGTLGIGGRF